MLKLNQCNTLRIGNQVLDVSEPIVMGILNLTDDSFYANSRVKSSTQEVLDRAGKMIEEGASILDLGGQSTRPGADLMSDQEEMDRVLPALNFVSSAFPTIPISIDTFSAAVAREAILAGAKIINDVSGFDWDARMLEVLAILKPCYVLMNTPAEHGRMHDKSPDTDIVHETCLYFNSKLRTLHSIGVNEIILDPGFGFGKTPEQNMKVIAGLTTFGWFNHPLMVGVSRKSTLAKITGRGTEELIHATTALHMLALLNGAKVLRVHDVWPAKDAISVFLNAKQTQDSK